MTLAAIASALTGNRMVERFHADPRVQATELLLQERVPRHAPLLRPRPDEAARVTAPVPPAAVRRFRSPHTAFPHAQFLSNGNYTAVVTNAGGGASFCRGRAVTRWRQDATRDPGGQYVYLRDVRSGRGLVRDAPADRAGRGGRRRRVHDGEGDVPAEGRRRSRRGSTSRSPPRTTSRCAGSW